MVKKEEKENPVLNELSECKKDALKIAECLPRDTVTSHDLTAMAMAIGALLSWEFSQIKDEKKEEAKKMLKEITQSMKETLDKEIDSFGEE